MKTAKSLSLEENTWYELQHEAKNKGVSLSALVEGKVMNKEDAGDINTINNNIILLNNKLILLRQEYEHYINEKIKEKAKEIEELEEKKKEDKLRHLERIEWIEKKTDKKHLKMIEDTDFSNNEAVFNLYRNLREVSNLSVSQIKEYKDYLNNNKGDKK